MTDRPTCEFYLIQRLTAKPSPVPESGFDGFFGMEYMGSSEYEWGAPNQALRSMRSHPLAVHRCDIDGTPVYFVADPVCVEQKVDDLRDWLTKPRSKEMSYFPERLAGSASDYMERTAAWWSFEDDIAWALDSETATRLLLAFETKRADK